jgi:hypothetical protein
MPAPTFTESDLHLSQDDIDALKTSLENAGVADPIPTTVTEQMARVDDYTNRYVLSDSRYKRLCRALVIYQLFLLVGPVPANHQAAYDEAMKELADIRDGKFPDLAVEEPTDLAAGTAAWGGTDKVE